MLDAREGSFLVGLDAHYAFADAGEIIDIGGGAEVFFATEDPTSWHLYLGQKDPVERRIHAEIFQLFEANAYFMLDSRQIATGAWIGYDDDWKFGPVRVVLQAWIAGDAVLSFKPLHFAGELWLHGGIEASVFGFGFGIGADARVAGEVFDPFSITIELAFHLSLPWPLPDFDIPLTLRWGPTPTAPPLPLKEVAVEHFLVTTSWPLPRTSTPALLTPNYDPDGDGFLDAPSAASIPADPPVVPLDARPHITFSRSVHDDALLGVNPQPPFPASQPDPGWEWIGDPAKNEGPTRMRTALKEIALERWSGTSWVLVARKATTPNPSGVPALFGSWAPVPQLPGGTTAPGMPPPAANTKLWLWSKSAFDYTRNTTGTWDRWFVDSYVDYPCIPIPPDETICCDFRGLTPGTHLASPWSCPGHPVFQLGWNTGSQPEVVAGNTPMLCFGRGASMRLRLGRAVKQVELYLTTQGGERERRCLDLRGYQRASHPNPFHAEGFRLTVFEFDGALSPSVEVTQANPASGAIGVLDIRYRLFANLPVPASTVEVTLFSLASSAMVEAYDRLGGLLDRQQVVGLSRQPVTVATSGDPISSVAVIAPQDETYLVEICAFVVSGGVVVTGIDRSGRESKPVAVQSGVATLEGRGLCDVLVRGRGAGFCVLGFCVVIGLSEADRVRLEALGQHTRDEVARWSQEGVVLQPYSRYRVKIVTTLETRDFPHDNAFNTVREQTEYAYFQTAGPPGLAALSVPVNTPAPDEFSSGLDELTRYVTQTIPLTVPASGARPTLPRPVYRAYDTGVEFGVDYVDLMYRISGRDLGLYLFDNNNQPARDSTGGLLVVTNQWGVAETLALTESDSTWIDLINASTCVTIDSQAITHTRTLIGSGQVLNGDTLYEARLIPLLAHELFTGYAIGQAASGTGATLPASGGGWTVQDVGTSQGPSVWKVGEDTATGRRYVEQQSEIWGGSTAASSPHKPGTLLLRANDPALAANDPGQPGNWTDYRLTAILTALDDDAIGLVVRYRAADDHYLFTMDRERTNRRLVKVSGGVYTTLAEDDFTFELGSDHTISIDAVGDRLRVYQDGAPVFDVADGTHRQGGIGLYAWGNSRARFADIRIDDLRAAAPVVYRYAFTTSRFTNAYHHLHSFRDEVWDAAVTDPAAAAAAVAAAVTAAGAPTVPGDAEVRAYLALAQQAVGPAALADTTRVEGTVVAGGGDAAAVLLRTAEPIDWSRTTLEIQHAAGRSAGLAPMPDPVPAIGRITITSWTPALAVANDESVTLLLQEAEDLTGYRLDYRTLPSAVSPAQPPGTELLAPDFQIDLVEGASVDTAVFTPTLDDLDSFVVVDPVGPAVTPSAWAAANGEVRQTATTGVVTPAFPFALPGTHLVGGDRQWGDVVVSATLRSDSATGSVGLLFCYQDEVNHYRFSISAAGSYRRLVKCAAGAYTVLWADGGPVAAGRDYAVTVEAIGQTRRVAVDGVEVCSVTDPAPALGAIGCYSWRCSTAVFTGLSVSTRHRRLGEWEVIDLGTPVAPSQWRAGGGVLGQYAAVGGPTPAAVDPATAGTLVATGDPAWTDVGIRVLLMTTAADALGVAFRWTGPNDHYLFVLDGLAGIRRLIRKVGGVATQLWQAPGPFPLGQWREVEIEAVGTRLRVLLDGVILVDLHDAALASGGVALYAGATGAGRFAALTVEAGAPSWLLYHEFAGDVRLAAGRQVRLFTGTEAALTLPPQTSEVRRFQGFLSADAAARRLPAEGVDLRLVAPDGEIVHARRFAPDSAYTAANLEMLRAADGTGLILVRPDASAAAGSRLPRGHYRLRLIYRRDNRSVDPASVVLKEVGDIADEVAQIDVLIR